MDGILLINKDKGLTSRDVVNLVSKKLNIKKVGHAGTLDPLATGLLVIGIGSGTKILDLLTMDYKEYIATVKMGIETDTLDITGKVIKENYDFSLSYEELEKTLKKFQKQYYQSVPKYSAVKIKGKKLYEYARENIDIELPKRLVDIKKIELLNYDKDKLEFTFRTLVSKGTYIRSLIKDIGDSLNINFTMQDLIRTKSGKFKIDDSFKIDDTYKIIPIQEALDFKKIEVKDLEILKKIKNGNALSYQDTNDFILFLEKNKPLAIYKNEKNGQLKAFKVF